MLKLKTYLENVKNQQTPEQVTTYSMLLTEPAQAPQQQVTEAETTTPW